MKTRNLLLPIFVWMLAITISFAQNYKAPAIDASGKITNENGKVIGSVTKEGVINDELGVKIGYIDATGTLIDAKTGEKLGKTEKNGNFVSVFSKTSDAGWTTSTPLNGTCLVKDQDGIIKAAVHENYKAFGACAIHCIAHHMEHGTVMETQAQYVCPMHPTVKSDKPGKCSKCGMALVKKGK